MEIYVKISFISIFLSLFLVLNHDFSYTLILPVSGSNTASDDVTN